MSWRRSWVVGDGLSSLTGSTLWSTLQQSRDNLELAYVLILARAGNGAVPCADIGTYNDLVAQQIDMETRGLRELQQDNVYSGLRDPTGIPTIAACQTGEQNIWLRPGQAQAAVDGAVARFGRLQQLKQRAELQGAAAVLGDSTTPALMVAGGALVGWAAQAVAERAVTAVSQDELQQHQAAVGQLLTAAQAAVPGADVQATAAALDQLRGRATGLPWGLQLWQVLVLAFAAGLAAAGLAWYISEEKGSSPSLSGAPQSRRRALVVE